MQQRGERHVERMADVSERAVDHIETMNGAEILNSLDEIAAVFAAAPTGGEGSSYFKRSPVPLSGDPIRGYP